MQAKLIECVEIAPGLGHFVFEVQSGEALNEKNFDFIPGQFVSFTADIVTNETGAKKITRAYSLASAPRSVNPPNRFELCLNVAPDGLFSHHLFRMKPGETVEMRPPLGMFVLRQPPRDSLFIATGTGIAPFRSMLKAHQSASSPQFTLLFGVRHESHLIYRSEFEELARQYPNFRFWPTLSRPEASWSGRSGRVQQHIEEALAGRRDVDVYLCGLKLMVDDVRSRLKAAGFDRKQIFYEKYD
jgi:CDP-4-dehydro-6-deoxyglucose reductase